MFQVLPFLNRGTDDPIVGRLFFGVLEGRNSWLLRCVPIAEQKIKERAFDETHKPIFDALLRMLESAESGTKLVNAHLEKASKGEIFNFDRGQLHVSESIDRDLKRHFDDLHIQGVIGLKATKALTRLMGINIQFLFAEDNKFEVGVAQLRSNGELAFADFLAANRSTWSSDFILRRGDIEHNGFDLPKVRYVSGPTEEVIVAIPMVGNRDILTFFKETTNRACVLAETLIFYSLQRAVHPNGWFVEVPKDERNSERPGRFKYWPVELSAYNWTPWQPKYLETPDFI